MGVVTTSLADRARRVFSSLDYDVTQDEGELIATRKWRRVRLTTGVPESVPTDGELRCFVTERERADDARRRVAAADPDYEWAVLGVDSEAEYDVLR